jgi:hypothetical protein
LRQFIELLRHFQSLEVVAPEASSLLNLRFLRIAAPEVEEAPGSYRSIPVFGFRTESSDAPAPYAKTSRTAFPTPSFVA